MKRASRIITLLSVAVLALAGCGGDDDPLDGGDGGDGGGPAIRVGSANFPESQVLAEVYAGALRAKGIEVELKPNIGAREAYLAAMTDSAELDVFPEYTGNLRLYYDAAAAATDPDGVYQELVEALPDTLVVLDKAEAEDKDAVVVTKETAEKYSLTSIGDLAPVAKDLTLGGPPEWKTRQTGIPGLEEKYGVVFGDFRELDAGGKLTMGALLNGQIDAGNIFSTDPTVASGELVALEDPESLFAAQNVVPLVRAEALTDDIEAALNAVSAALSQEALLELVDRAVAGKEDYDVVAADFLEENDLN